MRTDSTNISEEAREKAGKYVKAKYGDDYLPSKPNTYKSKSNAQEAHEAIRPSDVNIEPDVAHMSSQLGRMSQKEKADALRLYDLIWRRFVASQMTPARYENTTVKVGAREHELRLTGRRTLFDGHTRALGTGDSEKKEPDLPKYQEGETLTLVEMDKKQHFTQPPARYSEARLVRELESRGIGRPSTYSSIVSTIRDRGYITMRERRLYAEPIAEIVTDRLQKCFDDLMSYEFTAEMEERLDEIALGGRNWENLLDEFYAGFVNQLNEAEDSMIANDPVETDIPCKQCGRKMVLRIGATGTFLGCSGYSLPKPEQCRYTQDLTSTEEVAKQSEESEIEEGENESKLLLAKKKCPTCKSAMDSYFVDKNLKLHLCGDLGVSCDGLELEQGEWSLPVDEHTFPCNVCGGELQLTNGRFGQFFRCSNEACKNTRKPLMTQSGLRMAAVPVPLLDVPVEDADDHYVLREGRAGLFLGASKFPKVRKMRDVSVKELIGHAEEIEERFKFLLDAPETDGSGNDVFVRYDRKTGDHYVVAKREGKRLKWRANFTNGKWEIRS